MKNMRKVTVRLAGVSACAGTVFLLGFFLSSESQDNFLVGGVVAATISVVSLLVSTFCVNSTSIFFASHTSHPVAEILMKSKNNG